MKKLIFVLGGARSGKSTFAENWAKAHGQHVLFVATAQAFDDEMQTRISHHQQSRPEHWYTVEAPLATGTAIQNFDSGYDTLIVDCITLLATNVLLSLPEDCTQEAVNEAVIQEMDTLLAAYQNAEATWLIVSNEVGMGVVPPTQLGRFFRDALGKANQHIAQQADEVILMVAGLAWYLKPYP